MLRIKPVEAIETTVSFPEREKEKPKQHRVKVVEKGIFHNLFNIEMENQNNKEKK